MSLRKFFVLIALLTFTVLGCKIAEQTITLTTPTPEPTATSAEPTPTTPPTDTPAPTIDAGATQTAEVLAAQVTPTLAPPQNSPTPAGARETEQARSMAAVLERLASDGVIGSTTGEYHRLNDFDKSVAKLGYVSWWGTGFSAENFVLSANAAWQSASDKSNWPDAGCGFVFAIADEDNYTLAFLALDGYVNIDQLSRGNWIPRLARKRYGKVSTPDGDAKLLVAVYNKRASFYVNDQQVASANSNSLKAGDIAMTVLSGTNKDFGTRCQMTNVDLWILK